MDILTKIVSAELIVKKSRFFAELFPCQTPAAAREILKCQKDKYSDATHVVHAFVCGLGAENCGLSDDGEPGGTAGKPALAVLKGRGCTNVMLTITRWFGGTLLGTGGLVKAYGDSAKAALVEADESGAFEEYVPKKEFSFCVEYAQHEKIKQLFKSFNIYELHEDFGECVCLKVKISEADAPLFADTIKNATNGVVNLG